MTIHVREVNDIVVLHLHGEFNLESVPVFRDFVNSLIEKNKTKILVELQDVNQIDNAGIGALIATNSTLEENGWAFKILGLSSPVKRIFDFNSLQDFIEVYSQEKTAINAFAKRSL